MAKRTPVDDYVPGPGEAPTFARSIPGWFEVMAEGWPDAFVGCRLDEQGRVVVRAVLITGDALDTADLRSLPLGRIAASIAGQEDRRDWVASYDPSDDTDPWNMLGRATINAPATRSRGRIGKRRPLTRPDRSDPDAFYELVAKAYLEAVHITDRPAVQLAEEASVPVATVRRWVQEARRRGKLPPGRLGRPM